MVIKWDNTPNLQLKYIQALLKEISIGNFQSKGIFLFTEMKENVKNPFLVLPQIKETIKPENIENLKFSKSFHKIENVKSSELNPLKQQWGQIEGKFIDIYSKLFPQISFPNVIIVPSIYGLRGWQLQQKDTLYIFHRIDYSINFVIVSILNQIIINSFNSKSGKSPFTGNEWIAKQSITNFLFSQTQFKSLVPDYKSFSEQTQIPEINIILKKESDNNYKKLGYSNKKIIALNGNQIEFDLVPVELTNSQHKILKILLENEEKIVSFDRIAEVLWEQEISNKFSLTAMAKLIHELRTTLKNQGIQKEIIFTKRGSGYTLIQ